MNFTPYANSETFTFDSRKFCSWPISSRIVNVNIQAWQACFRKAFNGQNQMLSICQGLVAKVLRIHSHIGYRFESWPCHAIPDFSFHFFFNFLPCVGKNKQKWKYFFIKNLGKWWKLHKASFLSDIDLPSFQFQFLISMCCQKTSIQMSENIIWWRHSWL